MAQDSFAAFPCAFGVGCWWEELDDLGDVDFDSIRLSGFAVLCVAGKVCGKFDDA